MCFDKQAEFCRNYLRKGSLVYVDGRISYRQYEKDGAKQYITEILANSIQSLQSRAESQGAAGNFDANAYDAPAYGGNSYNAPAAPAYNAPAAPAYNPPAAPADGFADGIADEECPF